jgi:hypothetical protein
MKIILAAVSQRGTRSKSEATDRLLADYVERAGRYIPCESSLYTVVMLTSHNLVQCESNAIDHHGSQTGEDLLMYAVLHPPNFSAQASPTWRTPRPLALSEWLGR